MIKHADAFGLTVKDVTYDPKKVVERSRKVANQLSNGVKMLMRKNKIAVFEGSAKLAGAGKLAVAMNDKTNQTLTYRHVILATGARARQPKIADVFSRREADGVRAQSLHYKSQIGNR